ncbi:MAG TPA: iron-containing alcohol dehydrogenase [Prosthecochloris aestuarii]|uniref:Iron-containing alcohol dehydrogenase n=1 Tax=Prosthecochloris aestuarii TaxID=1102 RepID=A0A831SN57_PROAE|nr:iron-containing alcohol dehydrogenase [Prosthecochloris sp.]HED31617.1 iron-containing alcohol dehydrogenase [Prosthecochloris aestuarii]
MNFFLTTDLVIEVGSALKLAGFVRDAGFSRPALIYDASLESGTYFRDVMSAFKKDFPDLVVYSDSLGGEPTYAHLEEVAAFFRQCSPDGIVAIGGGSIMDLAKGSALLLANPVEALSLKGFPTGVNPPVGVITVPSILGSGAEVSYNAVFIDEAENRKLGINSRLNFPRKAIVDPQLSMTAPRQSVISSAMDSMVHCIDSFASVRHSDLSRMFSIEGFQRTFSALRQDQLDRAESRIDLALGSVCGTIALMNSGDGPVNGFAYYLGVQRNVPHGLAGAVFLKEVMNWNVEQGFDKYGVLNPMREKLSAHESSLQLLEELGELYRQLEIPSLSAFGYDSGNAADFADAASDALQGSFAGNPVPFDRAAARSVIERLL